MNIQYKKLVPDSKFTRGVNPATGEVASPEAAGYDLYCASLNVVVQFGTPFKIKTGIAVALPKGWVGLIRDRSSIGGKGVVVSGGVIDSDYRGELIVCLNNLTPTPMSFSVGDRIAQLVVIPCVLCDPTEVTDLPLSLRGEGGFGSTGK